MEKYFKFLDDYCQYDYGVFAKEHKSRAYTFKYLWDELSKIDNPVIYELGTTRSFVHGGHDGCMKFDLKYWFPANPELYDWSAGSFTFVFAQLPNVELHTVDINAKHIWVSKTMTEQFGTVRYHIDKSENFLATIGKPADAIYLDTGDLQPLEPTARMHEREAEIIVKLELVKVGGFILMDDARSPVAITQFGEKTRFGKDKYSIGVFLANGYDLVMDEYQIILKRLA